MFSKNEYLAQNSATRDTDNEQALYCHVYILVFTLLLIGSVKGIISMFVT